MSLFERQSLAEGVEPREVAAWSFYDFANSGYTTVVLTAVFNAYFVSVVAGNTDWATLLWTLALSVSSLLVMLTAPAIGAWADRYGAKKKLLAICTIGCVATTAALSLAQPGMLVLTVILVIVSNYFFSIGDAVNAAFLPELARPAAMGKVSGWGWSFGYFGGMLTLGLSLAWVIHAQSSGQTAQQFVPVTMLITAIIYAVASLPLFLLLKERAVSATGDSQAPTGLIDAVAHSLRRLHLSWIESRQYPDFFRLLVKPWLRPPTWVNKERRRDLARCRCHSVKGWDQAPQGTSSVCDCVTSHATAARHYRERQKHWSFTRSTPPPRKHFS